MQAGMGCRNFSIDENTKVQSQGASKISDPLATFRDQSNLINPAESETKLVIRRFDSETS
jgi:hypothetical protein